MSGWAAQGVPLKVAYAGIDRYFERYYRKGPRRRPVKIDFCDADVLDVFDEWRRAVGVAAAPALSGSADSLEKSRGPSLPAHLERVLLKLTAARATGKLGDAFDALIDRASRELDIARASAGGVRGDARPQLLARLVELDDQLVREAKVSLSELELAELTREAVEELASFRDRMAPDTFARAAEGALARLVRERFGLPTLTFVMMDTVSLTIEKPAAGGRMIARLDGQVVLVSGAIPGERVTPRIERAGKGVSYAATVGVDEASPDRRPVAGRPARAAAVSMHMSPTTRQLGLKSDVIADAFARIGKSPSRRVAVAASPESGYRMRARLHMRGHRLGFFREGTHDICDARATGQLLPATCDVLDRLAAGINSLGLDVRELELSENVDASDRAVSLDAAAAMDAGSLDRLGATQGVTAFGPDAVVTERMSVGGADISLRRSVLAFFQGNRYLLNGLAEHVIGGVARGATLVDLYAGAGLFAVRAAAAKHAAVRAVEGDRVSAADLIANVAAWDTVEPLRQPVEAFLSASPKRPDVVIVDPPQDRHVARGTGRRHPPARAENHVCELRCRDARPRRTAAGRVGIRHRSCGRVRSISKHAARRNGRRFCVGVLTVPGARRGSGAAGGVDEAFEQRAEFAGAPEIFRVPLDAEAEARLRIFDRFDDAVGRGGETR